MTQSKNKRKLRIYNKILFLQLLYKHKHASMIIKQPIQRYSSRFALKFLQFKRHYIPLVALFVLYQSLDLCRTIPELVIPSIYKRIQYYTDISRISRANNKIVIPRLAFNTLAVDNSVIFSKPKRQLFLMLYSCKPRFVFTGGLMRRVMNEKRKSSKRLYKVAVSLIKLCSILLIKRNFFTSCYLRLHNIGNLRAKILKVFINNNTPQKVHYVIIHCSRNIGAQKFPTRRSIKKYIKKRFKTNIA